MLAEIHQMRLPDVWRDILESIGPYNFLTVWRLLSLEVEAKGELRVYVPAFSKFEKLQRNLLIKGLEQDGLRPAEIRNQVSEVTGEDVSLKTIQRVLQ
ncbi:hypothetical protein [Saliniradius amylolyticus]|nr:hypothetical protein [Saliniradius amylolyticus]